MIFAAKTAPLPPATADTSISPAFTCLLLSGSARLSAISVNFSAFYHPALGNFIQSLALWLDTLFSHAPDKTPHCPLSPYDPSVRCSLDLSCAWNSIATCPAALPFSRHLYASGLDDARSCYIIYIKHPPFVLSRQLDGGYGFLPRHK